jgi:hypothetical protein
MTENSTQDERWYRVEHRVSGFDAGLFAATSPEEAIAAMMDDAGVTDQPSPDWIATEVEVVQLIQRGPWEDQGLVEYAGEPEELQEWIDCIRGGYRVSLVSTRVQGWGDYTAIVRLEDMDYIGAPGIYYLVTDAALKALGLEA